ncbi:MAG: glutathione S-transferase N-terminal domain-containing protein [Candidatus Gastranaerophilales bacterium]|nr:glutathione S-transferase N-terminal domain-containing protein [Candidatus Gastranaerophilales bacterium]
MKDVVIYTVDYCGYCKKAELLLNEKGIPYKKIDITKNENEFREKLAQYYDIEGKVTVPQIIIGGKRIGGYDVLEKLNNSGNLDELLEN